MEHVARQARQLKRACGKRDAEWGELSNAVSELADAVEALPEHDHVEAIKDHLLPLSEELVDLLRNIRSKLVSDACEQLGRIVKTTRLAFAPLANLMLQGLADTAKASSIAIRDPGFRLFSDVSEHSRYDLEVLYKIYRSSPQERVRVLLVEQLHTVLTYWPKQVVEPYYNEVQDIMRRGLRDPSSHVRIACRQTFCLFSDLWNERVDELVDVPTAPARELLIKEKPHAKISKAMQQKFGTTPSKMARGDSVSAIRQQRAAVKRQGSTVGDDAFIEVTDSPRRALQQPTVDAQKRGVPPGQSVPRAPSPSGTTTRVAVRSASSSRAPSPSSTARSASPGATRRAASPLFSGAQGSSAIATGGRTTSPGRSTQVSSPRVNGNGHTSATHPAKGRLGEFDRYLSLTAQENPELNVGEDHGHGSTTPAREKTHKRVSIAEPPTADPTRKLSFSGAKSTTFQADTKPLWSSAATGQDDFSSDSTKTASRTDRDAMLPATSPQPGSALTTSYAAAAKSFVSQSHPMEWHRASTLLTSDERRSAHDSAAQQALYKEPPGAHEAPSFPDAIRDHKGFRFSETSAKPDEFLDRPIPSSAPAPEPRASTNVTTRDRRQSVSRVFKHDAGETVAAAPVPEPQPPVQVRPQVARPRFLDETFPPPPFASIDAAFLQSNMASAAPAAESHRDDPFFDGGDVENKENVRMGQGNIPQKPVSKQVDTPAMDAISVLGALRGNIRATHEKMETAQAMASKPLITLPQHPMQSGVNASTVEPSKSHHVQANEPQPPSSSPARGHPGDDEKKAALAQAAEDPQRPVSAAQAKPASRPGPLVGSETTKQSTPSAEIANPVAPSGRATIKSNPRTPGMQTTAPPHSAPTDFIRAPAPFKFAPPQPRQQQKAHASAPQVRVPASGDPTSRPASEPARRNYNHEYPSTNQVVGLRQRQQSRELSPTHSHGNNTRAESSTPQPPDGIPSGFAKRHLVLNPQPQRMPSNVAIKMLYSFGLVLMAIFGLSGLIEAATKVRNAYEYHQSLLDRINQFEASIVESYESVRKMNEKYSVWSEYVRELTDQDESNAVHQLESIQTEVEMWQREMKSDLLEFKKSLSGDIIDAALAPLRDSNSSDEKTPEPAT